MIDEDVVTMRDEYLLAKRQADPEFDHNVIYWTKKDMAKELSVTGMTVNNYIDSRRLKAVRYKGKWLIHPDDAEAFIKGTKKANP